MEGIKIEDLRAKDMPPMPSSINIRIYTFEADAEDTLYMQSAFAELTVNPLKFRNRRAFNDNGFCVGFGRGRQWDKVAVKLEEIGAAKVMTNSVMIFDRKPYDIQVTGMPQGDEVSYYNNENNPAEAELEKGRFAFRITATRIAELADLADVKFETVFLPVEDRYIQRLVGRDTDNAVEFSSNTFRVKMSTGDFLFVGPCRYQEDVSKLGSRFFVNQQIESLVKYYLIVFMNVSD